MINFPNNPALGDAFLHGGTNYICILVDPIVWNAAPAGAPISDAPLDGQTYGRNTAAWKVVDKTDVGLGNVDNTSDLSKPISDATAAALSGKQSTISVGSVSQYWRGDQTWQVLNAGAAGAVAKAGDTMTGQLINNAGGDAIYAPNGNISTAQMVYAGAAGLRTIGPVNADGPLNGSALWTNLGQIAGAQGMGFYWDGGNANRIGLGAGLGGAWALQWNRSTGGLTFQNDVAAPLWSVDGPGNMWANGNVSASGQMFANGRITVSNSTDQASFYSPQGGVRVDGGGDSMYAPNGNLRVGYAINAGGRITGGELYANGPVYTNSVGGLRPQGYNDSNPTLWNIIANTNPGWDNIDFQAYHVQGQWAGVLFFYPGGGNIQFHISTGQYWGSIKALSFDAQSDATTKEALQDIPSALDVIDGIQAHTYKFITVREADSTTPLYGTERRYCGTMAQDWESRLPEAVSEATTHNGVTTKMLDHGAIAAITAQAVSELLQRVKALEVEVATLKGEA